MVGLSSIFILDILWSLGNLGIIQILQYKIDYFCLPQVATFEK
jgi:hypothetical protein